MKNPLRFREKMSKKAKQKKAKLARKKENMRKKFNKAAGASALVLAAFGMLMTGCTAQPSRSQHNTYNIGEGGQMIGILFTGAERLASTDGALPAIGDIFTQNMSLETGGDENNTQTVKQPEANLSGTYAPSGAGSGVLEAAVSAGVKAVTGNSDAGANAGTVNAADDCPDGDCETP